MINAKNLLIFIILLIFAGGCIPDRNFREVWSSVYLPEHQMMYEQLLEPERLKADIEFFLKTLNEVHPNPYTYISKKDFAEKAKELKESITAPMTQRQFFIKMAPLVKLIQDGHTDIIRPNAELDKYKEENGRFIPLLIDIDENKILAVSDISSEKAKQLNGQQIMNINGISADSILLVLRNQISGSMTLVNDKLQRSFAEDLYYSFNFEGPFEIEFADNKLQFQGIIWDSLKARENRLQPLQTEKKLDLKILDDHTGLLTVNSFALEADTFSSIIENAFTQIREDSIQYLIIDVRKNGGGDSDRGDLLISYITDKPFKPINRTNWKKSRQYTTHLKAHVPSYLKWLPLSYIFSGSEYYAGYGNAEYGEIYTFHHEEAKPPETSLRFNGDVYVLSGVRSFSSAVIFLTIIKDYDLATIVGQETGGPANHFGELYPFVLPNSKLWMHTSTKHFIRPSGELTSGGVKPDVQVKEITGNATDETLMKTLELIKKNK